MNIEENTKVVKLEEKQIFSLKLSKIISVTSGKLWLTIEGHPEDYFIGEGDVFKVPDGRHSVFQSIGKSSFWF